MNRVEFIGQSNGGKSVSIDEILYFFDHAMIAYNNIQNIEPNVIRSIADNTHSIFKLQIGSFNNIQLQNAVSCINRTPMQSVYGRSFNVNAMQINDNLIEISVQNFKM